MQPTDWKDELVKEKLKITPGASHVMSVASAAQRTAPLRTLPATWMKVHERMVMKYKQHMENVWELLAKVPQCQGRLSWNQEQHLKHSKHHAVGTSTATQLEGTEDDDLGNLQNCCE